MSEVIGELKKSIMNARTSRPWFVNDQLRLPAGSHPDRTDASLRVLPPALLPDTAWFAQADDWRGRQTLPYGAEVAAWLGSPLATADAVTREGPAFESFVQDAAAARHLSEERRASMPNLYYDSLAALFEKPDPAAPAFMNGEAWQRKSWQTALAGWAQLRHTWELQAKFDELTLGMSIRPAGFVEPNPEFFQRMGATIDFVVNRLMDQGVFTDSVSDESTPLAAGTAIYTTGPSPGLELWQRWRELERLTDQLEVLVQKELRGVDWNRENAAVLKNYGGTLGNIMGYKGNSYDTARDDAPRWTTVAHDPNIDRNLALAIGRPRAIYVLYPWRGSLILCRGAVMSYYEYPSARRLTDPEWKAELDGASPPPQPSWIQPLLPEAH